MINELVEVNLFDRKIKIVVEIIYLDLDECSMIANLCQYHCVNTAGSYKCICPNGFSLERGRQCQSSARWCQEHQNNTKLRCTISKPVKYVYSFVALPGIEKEILRIFLFIFFF